MATSAKTPVRYSAVEGARPGVSATVQLHNAPGQHPNYRWLQTQAAIEHTIAGPAKGRKDLMTQSHSLIDEALSLIRNYRTFTSGLSTSVKPLGLSSDGCLIVLLLRDGNGPSNTELAASLGLNLATATKIIDRLVSDNFVHRKPDPVDRRRIHIYLTEDGVDVARKAVTRFEDFMRESSSV